MACGLNLHYNKTIAMACSFTIPFTGTASSLVAGTRFKILEDNGQFDGDDKVGKFTIHAVGTVIRGSYGICDNEIMITIERKPFLVSCNMIRDYVVANLTV